jgi:hypothetical protein
MEIVARCGSCLGIRDEAGRVSGAGSLQKHCAARAKRQLSKSTRVVIQPTMIVRAIFGEGPLLALFGSGSPMRDVRCWGKIGSGQRGANRRD